MFVTRKRQSLTNCAVKKAKYDDDLQTIVTDSTIIQKSPRKYPSVDWSIYPQATDFIDRSLAPRSACVSV